MVVLPLPVGPTTKRMPCDRRIHARKLVFKRLRESDIGQGHRRLSAPEQPNHDLFAPSRRECGNSRVVRPGRFGVDMAILWNATLGHIEGGNHLDANHKVVVQPSRQFRGLPK